MPLSENSEETVEVPAHVVVQCPLVEFKVRRASHCATCPKFGGLEDHYPDPGNAVPFEKRYVLKCFGAPVKRMLHAIAED